MNSRHGNYQAYNYPIPETILLQTIRSQPMAQQYSSRSYGSTSSGGSYNSTADSYFSESPTQYEDFDSRFSAHGRHSSQASIYSEVGINPNMLQSQTSSGSRHHSISDRRLILPSSDFQQIANFEDAHARNHRRPAVRLEGGSPGSDKDSSKRVACDWPGCGATFSRKADVTRHWESTHEPKMISCDISRCERVGDNGFTRKDHLLEHKRGYHNLPIEKRQVKSSKSGRHDHH